MKTDDEGITSTARRAMFVTVGVIFVITAFVLGVVALAASDQRNAIERIERPAEHVYFNGGDFWTLCDHGNRLYRQLGYTAVAPSDPTCPQPELTTGGDANGREESGGTTTSTSRARPPG